ncbi:inner centromere protein A-like [Coccinella septempunctata]|uniref:inner centromere protein A-like n=1 Tax=Coccinella septempunctata TaxID=41139 RepID=UPI001D098C5E|nr:inner centromere protein A-like [Coccinella septempunctata]
MTRFARAKGSKSSNERVVFDPTPWHEMKNDMLKKKQEIEEEKKRREAEARRNENYQKFLKDREKEAESRTVWAEFPEDNNTKVNGLSKKSKTIKKQKNKVTDGKLKKRATQCLAENADKIISDEDSQQAERSVSDDENSAVVKNLKKKKLKIIEAIHSDVEMKNLEDKPKKKNINSSLQEDASIQDQNEDIEENDDDAPVELSSKVEIKNPVVKKVKTTKKKIVIPNNDSLKPEEQEKPKKEKKKKKVDKDKKETGIQPNITDKNETKTCKQQRKVIDLDSLPEAARKKILKKQEKRNKQVEKKKLKKKEKQEEKKEVDKPDTNEVKNPETNEKPKTFGKSKSTEKFNKSKPSNEAPQQKKERPKKQRLENSDIKRRKDFQPNKIMVNGNEIELEYFDGFPIKKEDALNLRKLKKEMISKGLPRSEINRTLKLERRKAEKALAREKKKVCFNCRKFGHNLSECPNLSNKNELVETEGTGVCFKCGASDHTSFACRVVKGPNFKYASCFICKEQGHISRQCPDNERGLYPKGGSCRVCGDVTHLKKDCPQFQEQQRKEEAKFQVETIFEGNPDDLAPQKEVYKATVPETHKPKIIKF